MLDEIKKAGASSAHRLLTDRRAAIVVLAVVASSVLLGCERRRQRQPDGPHPEVFHVRLAHAQAGPGRAALQAPGFSGVETVYVESNHLLTLLDVQDVSYTTVDGQKGLAFLFTSDGSRKLADATRANVNGRLAVFASNELFVAPVIREPILNGEAFLTSPQPEARLRELAQELDRALRP